MAAAPRTRRYRNVCFTSFRPREWKDTLDLAEFKYLVMQREVSPTTQREHWQGYAEFPDKRSFTYLKDLFGDDCHMEARRGTARQASLYCQKPETAVPGTLFEHGEISNPGKRTDISEAVKMIEEKKTDSEIISQFPSTYVRYTRGLTAVRHALNRAAIPQWRTVETLVLYGPTGTGKTRAAYEIDPSLFNLPLPANNALWFDGYDNQSTLLLDDFYGWVKHAFLLRILDGHPLDVPYKGGFAPAAWTRVIITSNKEPALWYEKHGLKPELIRRLTKTYELTPDAAYLRTLVPVMGSHDQPYASN